MMRLCLAILLTACACAGRAHAQLSEEERARRLRELNARTAKAPATRPVTPAATRPAAAAATRAPVSKPARGDEATEEVRSAYLALLDGQLKAVEAATRQHALELQTSLKGVAPKDRTPILRQAAPRRNLLDARADALRRRQKEVDLLPPTDVARLPIAPPEEAVDREDFGRFGMQGEPQVWTGTRVARPQDWDVLLAATALQVPYADGAFAPADAEQLARVQTWLLRHVRCNRIEVDGKLVGHFPKDGTLGHRPTNATLTLSTDHPEATSLHLATPDQFARLARVQVVVSKKDADAALTEHKSTWPASALTKLIQSPKPAGAADARTLKFSPEFVFAAGKEVVATDVTREGGGQPIPGRRNAVTPPVVKRTDVVESIGSLRWTTTEVPEPPAQPQ